MTEDEKNAENKHKELIEELLFGDSKSVANAYPFLDIFVRKCLEKIVRELQEIDKEIDYELYGRNLE